MRIAVSSDIHGNDLALEAVLADVDAQGIDEIVNLGDHVSGPLNAARTAEILIGRNTAAIRGNHDRYLLTIDPSRMGLSDRATHGELDRRHLDWLAALPDTLVHRDVLFLCHGTPASDEAYWMETLTEDGVVHIAQRAAIERMAEDILYPVILCGHTHVPRALRLSDGRLLVNPRSVGCPAYADDQPVAHKVEAGSPHARYAVVERTSGDWNVTFRCVAYDHMAASLLAAERNRPEWARALATGFVD
ncbi:metallophosphoesterase [Sinorhizobium medicae]|nr:metallophosphoesterase [Sinorhizobium medicae]MDX1241274.1 metallophosphoesterase [Sinorhizobium medicae]